MRLRNGDLRAEGEVIEVADAGNFARELDALTMGIREYACCGREPQPPLVGHQSGVARLVADVRRR